MLLMQGEDTAAVADKLADLQGRQISSLMMRASYTRTISENVWT